MRLNERALEVRGGFALAGQFCGELFADRPDLRVFGLERRQPCLGVLGHASCLGTRRPLRFQLCVRLLQYSPEAGGSLALAGQFGGELFVDRPDLIAFWPERRQPRLGVLGNPSCLGTRRALHMQLRVRLLQYSLEAGAGFALTDQLGFDILMRRQRLLVFACERCRKLVGVLRREAEFGAGRPLSFELCLGLCVRALQVSGPLALADELVRDLLTRRQRLRNFAREPRRQLAFALGGPPQLGGRQAFGLQFTLRLRDLPSRVCGRAFELGGHRTLAGNVRFERFAEDTEFRLALPLESRDLLLCLLGRSAEL